MIRISFIDATDEFYLNKDGHLAHRSDDGNVVTLILKENLKAFSKFISQEADKLEWEEVKAEEKAKS